ncbi:hypothetical protein DFQ26_003499 [Actinomortierella ambigua]|nr:hypothetical protein DFQ26_003499 [Actinomortierella ambigua]
MGQAKKNTDSETLLKGKAHPQSRNTAAAAATTTTIPPSAVTQSTSLPSPTSQSASHSGSHGDSSNTVSASLPAPAAQGRSSAHARAATVPSLAIQSASEKASSLQHAQAVETIKRSGSCMENERTAMALMQQYLTLPDDPESSKDVEIQIQISQAAVDAKGFQVLYPHQVDEIKNHHASVSNRIAALTTRLALESKIRDAAQSLLRLHANKKKLAEQASEHLDAANRKVDQVATELWKLTQLAAELQRTLLQHTAGVLALGVVRLEDQTRRERDRRLAEEHVLLHESEASRQIADLSMTIQSLEDEAFEAQKLLEDKDRAIARLMKQLDHQQQLFTKLDEQQQQAMALSRSQQLNLEVLGGQNDALMAEMRQALDRIGQRLHHILQQRQIQEKLLVVSSLGSASTSTTTLTSASSLEYLPPGEPVDAISSAPSVATASNGLPTCGKMSLEPHLVRTKSSEMTLSASLTVDQRSLLLSTAELEQQQQQRKSPSPRIVHSSSNGILTNPKQGGHTSATAVESLAITTTSNRKPHSLSLPAIYSALDALETHFWQSLQKASYLESELALVRRRSQTLSHSRKSSFRFKEPSSTAPTTPKMSVKNSCSPASSQATPSAGTAFNTIAATTDDPIRAALQKSLKDAIFEKEKARQELESERQRWQEDQHQRIKAMEETLAAARHGSTPSSSLSSSISSSTDHRNGFVELRRQLQEALEEIDRLNAQHQGNLKSMRQLFDIVSESKKHPIDSNSTTPSTVMDSPKQQHHQSPASGRAWISSAIGIKNGRASPADSIASLRSIGSSSLIGSPVGFSMSALIARVKELVARAQQLESDNLDLCQMLEDVSGIGHMANNLNNNNCNTQAVPVPGGEGSHFQITKKELERLQASSLAIQELENELVILKQHTDILLEENARLADLAAAASTNTASSTTVKSVVTGANGLQRSAENNNSNNSVAASERSSLDQSAAGSLSTTIAADNASNMMTMALSAREGRGIREMEEMLQAKDQILRDRDQFVRQQDEELQRLRRELCLAHHNLSVRRCSSNSRRRRHLPSLRHQRPGVQRRGSRGGNVDSKSLSRSCSRSSSISSGSSADESAVPLKHSPSLGPRPSKSQRRRQRRAPPLPPVVSEFETQELQQYRVRCGLLEEELAEARMMVAALESAFGGGGCGSRAALAAIQAELQSSQPSPTPPLSTMSSWLSSMGSLSFATLTGGNNSNSNSTAKINELDTPSSVSSATTTTTTTMVDAREAAAAAAAAATTTAPALVTASHGEDPEVPRNSQPGGCSPPASCRSSSSMDGGTHPFGQPPRAGVVAGATAALRKEFRRVMADLRNEKEQMVRKEVEERRRLEAVVRQLRRELATLQA